jgi:hypothetical protein
MVEREGQTEIFTNGDVSLMRTWFLGDASHRNTKVVGGEKSDSPTATFAKHANRGDRNSPGYAFNPQRVQLQYPIKHEPQKVGNSRRKCNYPPGLLT